MGKPKKLDLALEQLCKIAEAINKNREKNKNRSKEEKIDTDTFVRKNFKIDRKDFSFSIKDTGIEYNPRTFMYEIPDYKSTTKVINDKIQEDTTTEDGNTKVIIKEKQNVEVKEIEANENKSITLGILNELEAAVPDLLEMVKWYKLQKEDARDNSSIINELSINQEKLSGEIKGHSVKCYETIYQEFKEVCSQYKSIKDQDLASLALLEFINKYKK